MKAFKISKSGGSSKAKTLREIEAEFETKGGDFDLEDGTASEAVTLTSTNADGSTLTSGSAAADLAPGDGLKEAPWATVKAEEKKRKRSGKLENSTWPIFFYKYQASKLTGFTKFGSVCWDLKVVICFVGLFW